MPRSPKSPTSRGPCVAFLVLISGGIAHLEPFENILRLLHGFEALLVSSTLDPGSTPGELEDAHRHPEFASEHPGEEVPCRSVAPNSAWRCGRPGCPGASNWIWACKCGNLKLPDHRIVRRISLFARRCKNQRPSPCWTAPNIARPRLHNPEHASIAALADDQFQWLGACRTRWQNRLPIARIIGDRLRSRIAQLNCYPGS